MIVQIDNTNAKAVVSGHGFKNDCPDRVDYGVNNGRNMGKFDAVIESGHRAKVTDKHDFNCVSGHTSGHVVSLLANKGHYKGQSVLYSDGEINDDRDKGHFIGHVR
jgi:hypothetical protein